ncbi:MAG: hypothetical protein JXB32_25195 [Deltaproteobacteria bacterium]|nr:hypothetical protein [Deltaproteobacteria bacterium]
MKTTTSIGLAAALAFAIGVFGCAPGNDDDGPEDIVEHQDAPADEGVDGEIDARDDGGGDGGEEIEDGGVEDGDEDDAGLDDGEGGTSDPGRLGVEVEIGDGQRPSVASDSSGDPHVVFEDGGIWYTVGDGTTGSFGAPVRLSDSGNEALIAIDENDDAHVVWNIGIGTAGRSGWYTNNIGGSWKPAVRTLEVGDFGLERVMQGRVFKIPGRSEAVAVWAGSGETAVLVALQDLAGTPTVLRRVAVTHWVPGLVLDPGGEGFRVVARRRPGTRVTDYDFDMNAGDSFMVTDCVTTGESGWGVLTADGEVHYTGSPGGTATTEGPAQVWYSNDTRVAAGLPEIRGMVVATDGGTARTWTGLCVDVHGQAYVTHSSLVDTNAWIAYVRGEELISVALAAGYDAPMRASPVCAPAATGGVHVVYHVGRQAYYRTVGLP